MKVGLSWRINLWITCKKTDPNRTFFMDFGAFFVWILRSVGTFGALSITSSSHTHAYFLIDVQKSHFSSNFEKVPKSMKNVRFGSGFLHVIHKLILQDPPTFIYYQLTLYAAVWNSRYDFKAEYQAVSFSGPWWNILGTCHYWLKFFLN